MPSNEVDVDANHILSQSPLVGEVSFEVIVILSDSVPIATTEPCIFIYNPVLIFTVTPASIVKVTSLATKIFPVTV